MVAMAISEAVGLLWSLSKNPNNKLSTNYPQGAECCLFWQFKRKPHYPPILNGRTAIAPSRDSVLCRDLHCCKLP